jgi:hypothetical protein
VTGRLLKPLGEIGRTEVRVTFEHLERFMATDATYLDNIQATLEQPRHGLMSQIVES